MGRKSHLETSNDDEFMDLQWYIYISTNFERNNYQPFVMGF